MVAHPDTPPCSVQYVNVAVQRSGRSLHIQYVVEGPTNLLALPQPAKPYRADELWRTTCFELFVATGPESYLEFNFSPSSQWAEYRFDTYRSGMEALPVDTPAIVRVFDEDHYLHVSVTIDFPVMAIGPIGLSAVIEETDGTKSYWALAHAPGPPDFHNRDCFTATLPVPDPA
uniref:DOMON-like domain-containing protein n=1 Tax=uncultured Sphingomonas sp. TaxID=158754 RepID=UPI0035C96149